MEELHVVPIAFMVIAAVILFLLFIMYYVLRAGFPSRLPRNPQTTAHDTERKDILKQFKGRDLIIQPEQILINFNEVLGRGGFGSVTSGILRVPGVSRSDTVLSVAIKRSERTGWEQYMSMLREADRQSKLRHRRLIQLLGVVLHNTEPPWLVLERLSISLKSYLDSADRNRSPPLQLRDALRFFRQIAEAGEYLHSKAVDSIHGDIAARNFILSGPNPADPATSVKLGDFGHCRHLYEGAYYQITPGRYSPYQWMPPESFQDATINRKSDVWMFGIAMWEVLSGGEEPHRGQDPTEVMRRILSPIQELRCLPRPPTTPDPLWNLLLSCWSLLPAQRPTFMDLGQQLEDIAASPLVRSVSIEAQNVPSRGSEQQELSLTPAYPCRSCGANNYVTVATPHVEKLNSCYI